MLHPPKPIAAIIFDLDGTLIHTEPVALAVVREILAEDYQLTLSAAEEKELVGKAWSQVLGEIQKAKGAKWDLPELTRKVTGRYEERLRKHMPVLPGAVESVNQLSLRYPLGLVSGSTRQQITTALTQLKIIQKFKLYLGIEDYLESKPSPRGYIMCAERLKVNPKECIVLEDSNPGISAAKTAGMQAVAIAIGNYCKQDTSHADLTLPTLNDFMKWLTMNR